MRVLDESPLDNSVFFSLFFFSLRPGDCIFFFVFVLFGDCRLGHVVKNRTMEEKEIFEDI